MNFDTIEGLTNKLNDTFFQSILVNKNSLGSGDVIKTEQNQNADTICKELENIYNEMSEKLDTLKTEAKTMGEIYNSVNPE